MTDTAAALCVSVLVMASCGGAVETNATTPAGGAGAPEPARAADLLDTVTARGELHCGVNEILTGFGYRDASGAFTGFDVDVCRAVAAAVLGDAGAVKYVSLNSAARFEAVNSGLIDVLSRNTTWTQSRDTDLGLDFGPTTFYDGQQVMGKKAAGFTPMSTLEEIEGAVVCANAGTTTEKNITEVAAALGINIRLSTFEDANLVLENLESGACDVMTGDGSALLARRIAREGGEEWVIFPPVPISKEPLGPAWKQNQSRFGDVVTWTVFAMLIAEEKGIDSSNIDGMMNVDGEAARLFGATEDELQTKMGLPADAFYQVIKQVGNYAEVYDRHLTPLGLERGLNALYRDGGLLYPPPAR